MISSLWPIFIVNIGVNSFLSFLTLELLVLFALTILCIRNTLLRACCLLLPFIKIVTDIASYQFSNWALAQGLNPFMSAEGTRILNAGICYGPLYPLSYIHFYLQDGQTFTLADLLCLYMGSTWTLVCASGLLVGIIISLGYAMWQYYLSRQWISKIQSTSTLYAEPLQDPFLQASIQNKRATIYLTQSLHLPFIAKQRQPAIFISHTLFDQLSSQEFEAIIAHEMTHLRHGDLISSFALFWICHLFWWIPTSYFKKQIELTQEYACDHMPHTHLHPTHLANALYKASTWLQSTSPFPPLARPFATSHHTVKRLRRLLIPPKQEFYLFKWIKIAFLMSWIIILTLGKFWTF